MVPSYETVLVPAEGYYEEKRSRFIATLAHVTDEAGANAYVAKVRKDNREARHVVSAFLLRENGLSRFSDDGEPHGTAGKPVFDCLVGSGLTDVCLCVTRYFGGVLLGTGGLCRAYTAAANDCLARAQRVRYRPFVRRTTVCDYGTYHRVVELAQRFGACAQQTAFGEAVTLTLDVPREQALAFEGAVRETFAGTLVFTGETVVFLPGNP